MTKDQARRVFADGMKQARRHKLTAAGRAKLSEARAVLRSNPAKRKKPAVRSTSIAPTRRPAKFNSPAVEVYPRVVSVIARKGPGHPCDAECKKCNHTYIHDFTTRAGLYGMPDGSLKIQSNPKTKHRGRHR